MLPLKNKLAYKNNIASQDGQIGSLDGKLNTGGPDAEDSTVGTDAADSATAADGPNAADSATGSFAHAFMPKARIHPDKSLGWLRRLWPLVAAHRLLVVIGIVGGLVALATQVAVPAVVGRAIDAAGDNFLAGDDSPGDLLVMVWVLVALGVARFAFSAAFRYSLFKLAFRIDTELRALIYEHLGKLSFSYYDRTQSGDVISRANSDIRSIQIFFSFAPIAVISVLIFVFAFALMLVIHVPLALVTMCTMPAVHYFGMRFRRTVFPLSWITQARMAEVAGIVDENINGTRVVKSFAAEKQQIRVLSKSAQRLRWAATATVEARARFNPLIEALPRLSMMLVLLYGGWLAIDGQVSIGTLVAFNAYVIMLQLPFRLIGFLLTQGQRAAASAKRIYEVLDEEPAVADAENAQPLPRCRGEVRFEDVWFAYPRGVATDDGVEEDAADSEISRNGLLRNGLSKDGITKDGLAEASINIREAARESVLRGVDLVIQPGETVALVGATGCGKSTIARLVARFYDVDSGSVSVDGRDARDLQLESLRSHVGIVFDEPFLFSESLADNIAYGRPDATLEEVIAAATAAQIHEFIDELPKGYDTVVGERGYTLSGGQRQRVALARVLLERPSVLILDDATSAVDVHVEAAIHAALHEHLQGRTTILISHRLSTIELADRVLLMRDGKIAAQGTHAELMASDPHYAQILTDTEVATGADVATGAEENI